MPPDHSSPTTHHYPLPCPQVDTSGTDSILGDTQLLPHPDPATPTPDPGQRQTPRGLALTQFHLLLLRPARVTATCVLDHRGVFEDLASEVSGAGGRAT